MDSTFNQTLAQSNKPYWIWGPLAFTSFYFLPIIFSFDYFTTTKLVVALLIYISFLALYARAVYSPGEKAALPLLLMLVLLIAGTSINPGTQSLFGFAAFFCGFNFNKSKAIHGVVGVLLSIFLSAYLFNSYDIYFLAPAIFVTIGLFFFGSAERKDRIHRIIESQSQQKIEQLATIAERERIARDLHDLVGHSLSSIALKAELAVKYADKNKIDKSKQEMDAVANLSRQVLSEVRQAVAGLKQQSISTQLEKLKAELVQHGFQVKCKNELTQLPAELESNISLILTEAVTNILKHSKGDRVEISLTESSDNYQIAITDNGNAVQCLKGNGLQGIEERCREFNGKLAINHKQGFGLSMAIPQVES